MGTVFMQVNHLSVYTVKAKEVPYFTWAPGAKFLNVRVYFYTKNS